MQCSKCHRAIDIVEKDSSYYVYAYQVRTVTEAPNGDIEPIEDIGIFCTECLAEGV